MFTSLFIGLVLLNGGPTTDIKFRTEEVDRSLKVGYAVLVTDVNHDGKPDIVVVDTRRIVWFDNPGWKMRTIIQEGTSPDNVCIAAADVDGDGLIDFAVGADWKPFNTKSGGTLQWLKRGKTLDDLWTIHPISQGIPTIHRIRFLDLDGTGRPQLIAMPLMGRNSSQAQNWSETGVEVLSFPIPKNPLSDRWIPKVLDSSLHVVHNFHLSQELFGRKNLLLTASYEGVSAIVNEEAGKYKRFHLGEGNQSSPKSNRGSSEIAMGISRKQIPFIATIEPWHGHQVVAYHPEKNELNSLWKRQVIDEELKWGHAVTIADLNGDGESEIIAGVRDKYSADLPSGVRIYQRKSDSTWDRSLIDPGGVAVEDLAIADLNQDGKPDIIAVGRATGNVRIYWNETK